MSDAPKKSPTAPPGPVQRSLASVETPTNRRQMIEMARDNIEHVLAGNTPSQSDEVMRIPAENYLDPVRWAREVDLFKRVPLMLALGGELRGPSSYKAMTVMDVPVLITRGAGGEVRAFVNECSHRGAIVVPDGIGTARRFACPYHNWTYDTKGDLVGVTDREFFGEIDVDQLGLTPLPVAERAGMIFVIITPGTPMDIDQHLHGYDEVLDFFGFGDWHLVSSRAVLGPNWKIAYDGYLDFYHLPFLHRNTFGPDISNKPIYYDWGPHQRMTSPDPSLRRDAGRAGGRVEPRPDVRRRVDDLPAHLLRRRQRRRPDQPAVPRPDARANRSRSRTTSSPPNRRTTDDKRRSAWPTSSSVSCATRTTTPDCGYSAPSPHEPRSS